MEAARSRQARRSSAEPGTPLSLRVELSLVEAAAEAEARSLVQVVVEAELRLGRSRKASRLLVPSLAIRS
jgi:hypothetical protein